MASDPVSGPYRFRSSDWRWGMATALPFALAVTGFGGWLICKSFHDEDPWNNAGRGIIIVLLGSAMLGAILPVLSSWVEVSASGIRCSRCGRICGSVQWDDITDVTLEGDTWKRGHFFVIKANTRGRGTFGLDGRAVSDFPEFLTRMKRELDRRRAGDVDRPRTGSGGYWQVRVWSEALYWDDADVVAAGLHAMRPEVDPQWVSDQQIAEWAVSLHGFRGKANDATRERLDAIRNEWATRFRPSVVRNGGKGGQKPLTGHGR